MEGKYKMERVAIVCLAIAVAVPLPAFSQKAALHPVQQRQAQPPRQPRPKAQGHGGDWLRRYKDVPPEEQERALHILTSSGGVVQPRMVAAIERLICAEVDDGAFTLTLPPGTLAYAIVRLAEAYLFNDTLAGMRGDVDRLRNVEAALLGVPRRRSDN